MEVAPQQDGLQERRARPVLPRAHRRRGGVVSAAQRRWIDVLTSFGYGAVVCRGWEEARDALLDYTGRSAAREATENGNMDN